MTMLVQGSSAYDGWTRRPIKGDASSRRYVRLMSPDRSQSVIEMTTPPDQLASFAAFKNISEHLLSAGLSAPAVLSEENGTAIVSDLGSVDVASHLDRNPQHEQEVYLSILEVIRTYQSIPAPTDLPALTPEVATAMIKPFFDWFAPTLSSDKRRDIESALGSKLSKGLSTPQVLNLRDFHAQNIIFRADETGISQFGLLDFQDAFLAPPEYDLASLLRDARRDVAQSVQDAAEERFAQLMNQPVVQVQRATCLWAVQRNLRILGLFVSLAKQDGKSGYLALINRVRAYVLQDIRHPACSDLRPLLDPILTGGPTE